MTNPAASTGPEPSLRDRVCLVTGATSGIGRVAATALAEMGATVLLTGRDRGRGETAVEEIRRRGGRAEFLQADFASLRAVRELAAEVRSRSTRLDVLLNNAGGVNLERRLTPDGFEQTFAVNHLAAFLLTEELRDLLVASAPARIVTVSSEAHRALKTLDFDNLQGERRYKPLLAYSISKLANVMFTYELDRQLRDRGVTANCVHPGVVNTGIWGAARGFVRLLIRLAQPFMISVVRGARPLIKLASDPGCAAVSGCYFEKEKAVPSSPLSYDTEVAARLWETSAALIAAAHSVD
jgi:NAD(P)-dependent dehydrogenase (short-subunit alcohol dehydrogenase family)